MTQSAIKPTSPMCHELLLRIGGCGVPGDESEAEGLLYKRSDRYIETTKYGARADLLRIAPTKYDFFLTLLKKGDWRSSAAVGL